MSHLLVILLRAVLTLAFLGDALGAEDIQERARPALRVFGSQEGLPTLTLNGLALDLQGRLLVAGREGAARFNGRRWTPLDLPMSGTSSAPRSVLQTHDGALWYGTQDAGLWRFQAGTWTHFRPESGFPHLRVNSLLETRDRTLWAATGGGGLARFAHGTWHREEGLFQPWVWKVFEGEDGTLWAGTQNGLFRRQGRGWEAVPGLSNPEVNDVLEVPDASGGHTLWVCLWGTGLASRTGAKWSFHTPATGFPSTLATCLALTSDGAGRRTLWAGTYDAGLAFRRGDSWRTLNQAKGFPAEGVYALLPDPQSRSGLWVGTRGQGLIHVEPGAWQTLDARSGLPSSEVTALAETFDRNQPILWLGTSRGLTRLPGEGSGAPKTELQGKFVNSLAEFQGELWAGTPAGLFRKGGRGWDHFDAAKGLPDIHIRSLLSGEWGGRPALWVGTTLGLARFHEGRWTRYGAAEGLTLPRVGALAQTRDPNGDQSLWTGSWGAGVGRLRQGGWTHYGQASGLPNLAVTALRVEASKGGRTWIWAATMGGGLARLDLSDPKERWEVLSTRTHPLLGSNSILRLEMDRARRLYAGTSQAVVRISLPPDRNLGEARLEPFTLGDGLPTLASTSGASLVDHEGHVWFTTPSGAAVLNPEQETPLPPPGTLAWEAIYQGDRFLSPTPPRPFGHRENRLRFDFLMPSLHRQDEIHYRTQLVGLEGAPGPWGLESYRDFSALPRGSYTFQVWARDVLGRESGPLAWSFQIRPAPWLSLGAFAAYAVSALLAVGLAIRWRTRALQAQTLVLEARVAEATEELRGREQTLARLNQELWQAQEAKNQLLGIAAHDLKSPLSAILPTAQLLAKGGLEEGDVQEMGHTIFTSARQMVRLVTRLLEVDALERGRLEVETVPVNPVELVWQSETTFQSLAAAKGLHLKVEGVRETFHVLGDPVYLQQVMDNLVSNAVKFTPPGPPVREVFLRYTRAGNEGLLEVQDQGPGFTEEDKAQVFGEFARLSARPTGGETSTGLGLSITKRLVVAMGGRLELHSEPGQGATFRILLPLA